MTNDYGKPLTSMAIKQDRYARVHSPRMWKRITAALMAVLQLLTTLPASVRATEAVSVSNSPTTGQRAVAFSGQGLAPTNLVPVLTPTVMPHGPLPHLDQPSLEIKFTDPPTDQEIFLVRLFEEPLIPIGKLTAPQENRALARAILDYRDRHSPDDVHALTDFLASNPNSAWRISLLVDLGLIYRRTGYFTKAMGAWSKAWQLGQDETSPRAKALVDRAIGELIQMNSWVGRYETVETLLAQLSGRKLTGPATQRISAAHQALWLMNNQPETSFLCGPYALERIRSASYATEVSGEKIRAAQSTKQGTSLLQLQTLASDSGMEFRMAKRERGAPVILPAIVHWKLGHYGALVKESNGRYLLQDPTFGKTFGDQIWISRDVIDSEASGYFLIPNNKLPKTGWQVVNREEGGKVWGRGLTSSSDPNETQPCSTKTGGDQGGCSTCPAMPRYSIHTMLVSLNIMDTPLRYTPPLGPAMNFTITYNELDANQPGVFTFSNLGAKWTYDWLAYITDFPSDPSTNVTLYLRGGGALIYNSFDTGTQSFTNELRSGAKLYRTSTNSYERRFSDGSKEIYSQPDCSGGGCGTTRRVFLTQIVDPTGTNAVTLTYDPTTLRLTYVVDAIGQTNTLSYSTNDTYQITRVTDPFGRFAAFHYDDDGHLNSITDEIGMTSTFNYSGYGVVTNFNGLLTASSGDFIDAMNTPYGQTVFVEGTNSNSNWLQATDPRGGMERVEYDHHNDFLSATDSPVPSGIMRGDEFNNHIFDRNSFFWDKKAMESYGSSGASNYANARVYHWLHTVDASTSGILESQKNPLENRVWFNYQGQTAPVYVGTNMLAKPSVVARVLDDGVTTELSSNQYTVGGRIAQAVDPLGRTTAYTYDPTNQIDLVEIDQREINGGVTNQAVLSKYSYNSQHLPVMSIDASGQTNTFTYNAFGQITSVTNSLGQVTTMVYSNSFLTYVIGPIGATNATYTYDGYNRIRTVRDSEGYTVTMDYDTLDRLTQVAYPDGTTDQTYYDKLDAIWTKDRLNRWTRKYYNALRQLTAVIDPLNRVTTFNWCTCGSVASMTDPLDHTTSWTYDLQGRVIQKQYDDSSSVSNAYENTTSRLKSVTDAEGQTTLYAYNVDDTLQQVSFSNAVISTPSVTYAYDTNYNRVVTMTDGTGTTTYNYNPTTNTVLGAGQLASETGPLGDSTITYTYDALGRVLARAINGVTNSVAYDVLGRVATISNALGAFTNSYVDVTSRLSTMTYPNGQVMTNTYFGNLGDQRLQEIWNQNSSAATISRFDYTYNAVGDITAWTQQIDATITNAYIFSYDRADQLLGATLQNAVTLAALTNYYYAYDGAGNRTSEQLNSNVTQAAVNNLNQITSLGSGGALRFRGSVNETSTVTVAGQSVSVMWTNLANSNTLFDAAASVSSGVNTIQVIATDYSFNARTNNYQITVGSQAPRALTYDRDGNLTNVTDGAVSTNYQWDAANRLVGITAINGTTTNLSAFTYDGLSRRVRIAELSGATTNSDKQFLWCGTEICEERDTTGTNVTKRFFGQGEQIGGTNYFFALDHLGSVRELTDGAGNVHARYNYDPWGRRTKVAGDLDADFQYTGDYFHAPSGLSLTLYRAYAAEMGRWTSRDPAAEAGGINLYAYVANVPVSGFDPLGEAGVATAAPSGIPEAELGESSLVSQGEIDAALAALEEAGGITLGSAIAAGAVGGAIGYGGGRLADNLTGGALSGGVADTLQPLMDALYGVNLSGSTENCKDPCKGLRDQLRAHQKKLEDYLKDPFANDNLGILKDAPPDRQQKIIDGRIRNLENQIKNFKKLLEECEKKNGL